MPFTYPRVDIKINMQGIKQTLEKSIGFSFQPNELYEIFNTARDPDGQPYWSAVNDGTRAKHSGFTSKILPVHPSIGKGLAANWKYSGRGNRMKFWVLGGIISRRMVGPNPPVHMRERAIPTIRNYFSRRVSAALRGAKATFKIFTTEKRKTIGGMEYIANPVIAKSVGVIGKGKQPGVRSRFQNPDFWVNIMEDTMDWAILALADLTPIIKSEYYAEGYTSEPGTLRDSYEWQRRKGTYVAGFFSSSRKRLTGVMHRRLATRKSESVVRRLIRRGVPYQKIMEQALKRKPKFEHH